MRIGFNFLPAISNDSFGHTVRPLRDLRPFRRALAIAVLILAGLQVFWERYYWQLLPAYAVFVLATFGLSGRAWLALFSIPALSTWLDVPVPELTQPAGRYAVGTEVFRWMQPADARKVVGQAWYQNGLLELTHLPSAQVGSRLPWRDGLS